DQPAGKHRLLLVSPREGSDRAVGVRRGELERLDLLAGRLFLGPFIEYSPMRESTERRQGDVPVNRLIEEQSLTLALFWGEPDATGDGAADVARAHLASLDRHRASGGLACAVSGLESFRSACADEAG